MNHRIMCVLLGTLLCLAPSLSGAEDEPAGNSQKAAALQREDVRAIFESGQVANALPSRVVVHISAHLTRVASPTRRHGAGARKTFNEMWEFTAGGVHRVVETPGENGGGSTLHRAESIPFDTAGICKEMLDGGVLKFGEADKGRRENFIDTEYDIGHRSIEVLLDGKSVLWVGESCVTAGYVESDARAFAALYEKLATKARDAFAAKNAPHPNTDKR
jgi:hypothetical protein